MFKKIFKYRQGNITSKLVWLIGRATLKLIPAPAWVTVKTPYGVLIAPKSFRIFTMRFGLVEPEIQGYFEKQVREADVFVDIGAGIGYYILKAYKLNTKAILVGIEPDPVAYQVLKANLAINFATNERVKVFQFACSDFEEEIFIKTCIPSYANKSVAKPLDILLKSLKLQISRKSLILMDVEGAGIKVLQGSKETLEMKPRLIIELHPGEENVEPLLRSYGYAIKRPSRHFIIAS
jgi:FkbM family methyltransferase